MDEDETEYQAGTDYADILTKVGVGLVLATIGFLVVMALVSFLFEGRGGSLDALPAADIKKAVDAVAAAGEGE